MGILSGIASTIGKGIGFFGNKLKGFADTATGVIRRFGENVGGVANGIANIIGNNPVGNFVKGVGSKAAEIASGPALNIARTVGNIGRGISNIGRQVGSAAGVANDSG